MHNEVLEELIVVKRSGQRVSFNASKVAIAIKKAFDSVNTNDDKKIFKIFEKVLSFINDNYRDRKTINVEDIQDIIENTLYNEKCYEVYNSFKDYREKRALSRKVFAEKQQHKFIRAIERIEESSLNRNGTMNADDLIYDFGKIISSEYTKSYVLDTKSVRAAEEGNIYIHDLDFFTLGMFPSVHLNLKGNVREECDVDILINEIINSEREVYDQIGINNLDLLIEPFVLKRFKDILIKNLNKYLTLFGFIDLINFRKIEEQINLEKSINILTENYQNYLVNEMLEKIFINAKEDAEMYAVASCERILTKLFLNLENRSQRKNIFSISFGLNTSDVGKIINNKIFELLSLTKYAKIRAIIKQENLNMDFVSHIIKILETSNNICIQFNQDDNLEYFADGVKIYHNANTEENDSHGRMVVSSTSINLARLGLKHKNKPISNFYEDLNNITDLVKNELLLSFETIGSKNKEYYQTLFSGNIYDDEKLENGQKIRKVIKNGYLNIGLIGLKECALLLADSEEGKTKIIKDIIDYLNKKCEEYTKDTKLNFGLYEPISKHARARLLAIDKAIYGIVTDVTDKKHYDLLDVDLFENIKRLSEIQKKFSSGKLITINLIGKLSIKKVADTLEVLKTGGVEFARLVVGKDEY